MKKNYILQPVLNRIRCHIKRSEIQSTRYHSNSATVDNVEVEFHEKHSSGWWNENGSMAALHALNRLRIPFIRNGLVNSGILSEDKLRNRYPLKGISILDVGCGGGLLSENLARIGSNVTGLDPSDELIHIAEDHASRDISIKDNLRYLSEDIESHAIENRGFYDAVVVSEVIEHVTDKEKFMRSCISTLKESGSLFVTTPSKTLASKIITIDFAEFFGFVPAGTHDFAKFISCEDLQRLLQSMGCSVRSIQGYSYNPISNKCFWTGSRCLMYALHAVKLDVSESNV